MTDASCDKGGKKKFDILHLNLWASEIFHPCSGTFNPLLLPMNVLKFYYVLHKNFYGLIKNYLNSKYGFNTF